MNLRVFHLFNSAGLITMLLSLLYLLNLSVNIDLIVHHKLASLGYSISHKAKPFPGDFCIDREPGLVLSVKISYDTGRIYVENDRFCNATNCQNIR